MRHLHLLQGTLFAGAILALAALAGTRSADFRLPQDTALVDGRMAKAFESHYDEVFPVKTFGTNLWAAIEYRLFGEGRAGVVVGEQGWLYTKEEFRTYADAEAQVALHLALIPWVQQQLAARKVQLVVAALPAKARIYPEHLGGHQPARIHRDLHARLRTALADADIAAPDLAHALAHCKRAGAVFLRTDTHWTPAGAQCAARAIGSSVRIAGLQAPQPTRYRTRVREQRTHAGDLMRFLPLDPYFAGMLPAPDQVTLLETMPDTRAAAGADELLGDAPLPQVVLVGTSYSADSRWNFVGALQEALREDVVNYAAEGRGPFVPMLDYLASEDLKQHAPRLVIWEVPERYLPVREQLDAYDLPADLLAARDRSRAARAVVES